MKMKKYIITGMAALTMGCTFTSCSHDTDFDENAAQDRIVQTYETAFVKAFGTPSETQDWGFGISSYKTGNVRTRSQSSPQCPDISAPYDASWVNSYNSTAKEPNSANVVDNYDNSTYAVNNDVVNNLTGDEWTLKDNLMNSGKSWEEQLQWMLENRPNWLTQNQDETYVTKFKITGTWDGGISVAASEGSSSPGSERTIVVTGTWNITENQRIGSKGLIVIADGGTVNVSSGVTLNMVNEARLVVLRGGTLTGNGKVEVNNGNAAGLENYNGGTIDVAVFNNNFGKFYNYGKFLVTEYQGGAQESNFYNHSLVSIEHTGLGSETPNARIFNACQWYCSGDMRARNLELIGGSSFIVGGQLMLSGSEDGTTTPTYVGMASGALLDCGSLYNNGTSWSGPTSGWAVLHTGQFDFLNWEQDAPASGGYFENNIYVEADEWSNIPGGNGYQEGETATANYKFWHIVANCRGNGNVTKVKAGNKEIIPRDNDFALGTSGCTPGYSIEVLDDDNDDDDDDDDDNGSGGNDNPDADIRVIAEDLTVSDVDNEGKAASTDFDFNDVVFDVEWISGGAKITLQAAGGTLPLVVGVDPTVNNDWERYEVHKQFGVAVNVIVNTNWRSGVSLDPVSYDITGSFGEDASNIPVWVQKGGKWIELSAAKGVPASKIGVAPTYDWCNEREAISTKYKNFSSWVTDGNPVIWW